MNDCASYTEFFCITYGCPCSYKDPTKCYYYQKKEETNMKHGKTMGTETDSTLTMTVKCVMCGREFKIDVPRDGFEAWSSGKQLIQHALPGLTAEECELLMSRICGECYDEMFDEEDEEDDV